VLFVVPRLGERCAVCRRPAEATQKKQLHEDQQERQRGKREGGSKENVGPAYRGEHA